MRQPEFYAAVVGLIQNQNGKYLCIKRKNTGYYDGYYGFPAGHIEGIERPSIATCREILEEVGLIALPEDIRFVHVSHRIDPDRVTIHFYFRVERYSGTPTNIESDKSEGIFWIDPKTETKIQFRETLEKIENGEIFSEINLRS